MRKLNELSDRYFSAVDIEVKDKRRNGKSLFVPELIDIICPSVVNDEVNIEEGELVNMSQICIVMEYLESDFD